MSRLTERARALLRDSVRDKPAIRHALVEAEVLSEMARHSLADKLPQLIRPRTRKLTVAITAQCNLRCIGCRYGRDFMPGHQLSLEMVRDLLDDGRAGGAEVVRLYGGEPLLHPDLPAMVRHARSLGLSTYVTTNGVLLERRLDELFEAGLRDITLGFYGTGAEYDGYVQRSGRFERMERGLAAARERYGNALSLQLNFLIMRPSCNPQSLAAAWEFACRYDMTFHTDLVHYSLPYFAAGLDGELQFREQDRPAIEALAAELVRLKQAWPERIPESEMSLRSIPDWLMKGADMRVPCDAYNMVWVGADGSVKLCYVTFDLGNLHDKRLRDMLYGPEHRTAARDAFALKCPNCHCERDNRIKKHLASRRMYGR